MTDKQSWNIIFGETVDETNYFWIRPCEEEEMWFCGSSMDDNIRISNIDFTLNICLW